MSKTILALILLFPALSYGGFFADATYKTARTEKGETFVIDGCVSEIKFKSGVLRLTAEPLERNLIKVKYEIVGTDSVVLAKGILQTANKGTATLKVDGANHASYTLALRLERFRTRPSMLGYYTCEKPIVFD